MLDLSSISLAELINVVQTLEQRRLMRQEGIIEGVLQAQIKYNDRKKNKNENNKNEDYPLCTYFKKINNPQHKCWWRPDTKYSKCG